ncbi:hypothetical protein D9757_006089 [Collybiopsis confluens]|uniref:CCR4-Not complex 3'-5'-exoribonuclease subunit Ccr4 n=1 Tax=Collybiopsis confluens TaxID=2823264 RepID=A0A8H5HHH8_9AGAR|nr:hypothetical protein D9757_006089 [Collybiopsis confluens]
MVDLEITSLVFETHATGLSLQNSAKCYRPLGPRNPAKQGLVLMMAHGTGYNKEHWQPTVEHLFDLDRDSERNILREVWAVDVQNHGEAAVLNEDVTRERPEAWSIWDYADAFATLRRDILGSDLSYQENKFVLVAHSASATAAILTTTFFPFPSLHPSTFHSLILIEPAIAPNPSFIDPARHTPLYRQISKLMASRKDTWLSKDEAKEWMKERIPWGMWDERVLELYVEFGLGKKKGGEEDVSLRCTRQTETIAYERGIRQSLPGLSQLNLLCTANAHMSGERGPVLPIHVIWGDIDDLFSREVKDALEDTEQGRVFTSVRRVADAGHMMVQISPEATAQALWDILCGDSRKLGQETWPRQSHLQVLSPGVQQSVGPPPTSPGYSLYTQAHHHLGPLHHIPGQQPPQSNHNHNPHYPSPPIQHGQLLGQASPASTPMAQHWQQQLLKCEIVRQSRSPHHRARASAMASRTVAKSAIPITNPNPKPPPDEFSGSPTLENGNASHPSSTVAPIAQPSRPRPEFNWTSLDMGGIHIKTLPSNSGLFSFTFLSTLYLNHNELASVPSEITQLRNLELLDLSDNNLTILPPELGLLVSLKEFFLFDNQIGTIPHEFGTLHQLQTLGIEGNPLEGNLKSIITKDGTPALISYLRDSCPLPSPPQHRTWIPVISQAEQDALPSSTETISVLCYNILCQRGATTRLYGYTPSWALQWDYRRDLILNEILAHGADFICLQEVDVTSYEDFFVEHLTAAGYESVYWPKSRAKTMSSETERRFVDGLATFFRADKYQLIEKHLIEFSAMAMQRDDFKKTEDMFNRVLGKDHIATSCAFENRETGSRILVANVHILWDPRFCDVKLVYTALMTEEVEKMAERFVKLPPRLFPDEPPPVNGNGNNDVSEGSSTSASSSPQLDSSSSPSAVKSPKPRRPPMYTHASQIPLIFCGDFNSIPGSGVYEFLSTGALSKDHPDFAGHIYGKYTGGGGEKGIGLKSWLGLKSAYAANPGIPASVAPSGAHAHPPTARAPSTHALPSSSIRKSAAAQPSPELLPTTNYTPSFSGVLDYIWYSGANLGVNAVLGEVDPAYLSKTAGFPNVHFPSE